MGVPIDPEPTADPHTRPTLPAMGEPATRRDDAHAGGTGESIDIEIDAPTTIELAPAFAERPAPAEPTLLKPPPRAPTTPPVTVAVGPAYPRVKPPTNPPPAAALPPLPRIKPPTQPPPDARVRPPTQPPSAALARDKPVTYPPPVIPPIKPESGAGTHAAPVEPVAPPVLAAGSLIAERAGVEGSAPVELAPPDAARAKSEDDFDSMLDEAFRDDTVAASPPVTPAPTASSPRSSLGPSSATLASAARGHVPGAPAPTAPPAASPTIDRRRSLVRIGDEEPRTVRSPLVGRAEPLATLVEVIQRAGDFQAPQLATVIGNQGTGKTRLINELITKLTTNQQRRLRVFHGAAERDADGQPVRMSAITTLLRDRFELTPDPDEITKIRFGHEIRTVLGTEQVAEMMCLIGSFVGLDFPKTPFLTSITESAKQHAELARMALRRFLELDAAHDPLVLVFDDMQWADAETLGLISDLAGGLAGSAVVVLAAARPDMLVRAGKWFDTPVDQERVDLRNLEAEDAEQMFRYLLARCGDIPEDLAQTAVEQTGGNPAFLEQLVRLYLDNGAVDARGPVWTLDPDRAAETELPVSIEEAIEARIAALENDERELLEKASVFGNVFWVSAVIAMTRLDSPPPDPVAPLDVEWGGGEDVRRRIGDLISILADQDYLLPLEADDSSIPGESEVVFKHNLERELVIRSTEPGRLARYYLAAAQWLEAKTVLRSDEQLEFLANLYERGGDAQRAARCYLQGGDRARARYAPEEARVLYEKGLKMIGDGDAPARMDALHNLGDVLERTGHTDDATRCFVEMLQLSWRYDNLAKAGAAYIRLARGQRRLGKYDHAMEHLRRAHELFERSRDDRGIASTLDEMGRVNWLRGGFGQALDYHRQALTIRRALGDRRSIALSLANIGRVHHDTGNFKAAIGQFREALDLRRDIGDRVGIVQSLCDLGGVYFEDGNLELALELLAEARTLAQEIGDKLALADVLSRTGEVKNAMGRGPEAVVDLSEAKTIASELGDRVALAVTHQRLAQVQLVLGDLAAAEHEALAAVAVSEAIGLRVHIGCGYRVKAEVAAALGQLAQAEEDFRRAIDILVAVKHEVELARAYQGFATLKEFAGATAEAQKLRGRAIDIFNRLRGAAATE